ncbi:NEDD8-specific protease 1 isoform X2 [Hermetia illucens]|uniref:NEDD8-specific protease 1 isoform X2 n=1 Tax=Hermetia illucens TaxID=343691 RepID=UPI0018CC2211|nr:NEDD8-specific protease 1 isoform X2 [Hermetia illucens]
MNCTRAFTCMSSRHDTTSPTDTACSSESPAMLGQAHLMYDQHSSEEELEVINGSASVAAAASILVVPTPTSVASESSSVEPEEEVFDESPKRANSTILETRKRSLPHSSDDEVRNLLEPVPAPPVNFRTSPPLEALKPNRSHSLFRATTPLILTETSRGIESIRISCDSSNSTLSSSAAGSAATSTTSSLSSTLNNHHQPHHLLHHHHHHHNSSNSMSSPSSALSMDVRSVSPPAKLFHCAMSPRRRPPRTHHAPQRLQRPHRPCLDFDKMQQINTRSVTSWHNPEHTGELSVFCW